MFVSAVYAASAPMVDDVTSPVVEILRTAREMVSAPAPDVESVPAKGPRPQFTPVPVVDNAPQAPGV